MTNAQAFEWRDITAPVVRLREPDQDGLELHLRQATVPLQRYGSYAIGDVVTVSSGSLRRHENVLLSANEPNVLARWLDAALNSPRRARILTTFDDEVRLRIQGDGHDWWTVECRPVPMPPPSQSLGTFPHFSFRLSAASIQRAISELQSLADLMPPREDPKWPDHPDARTTKSGPDRLITVVVGMVLALMGAPMVVAALLSQPEAGGGMIGVTLFVGIALLYAAAANLQRALLFSEDWRPRWTEGLVVTWIGGLAVVTVVALARALLTGGVPAAGQAMGWVVVMWGLFVFAPLLGAWLLKKSRR